LTFGGGLTIIVVAALSAALRDAISAAIFCFRDMKAGGALASISSFAFVVVA
jgi:hypothetical protein